MLDNQAIEAAAVQGQDQLFAALRQLSLDDLGYLYLGAPKSSTLTEILPRLASQEVQQSWTGVDGVHLMETSKAFLRSVDAAAHCYTGTGLDGKTVLDYGCGYGRLLLMLYKFTTPDRIYGCDPWTESLRHCVEAGVKANLSLIDYVPTKPAYPPALFDVGYSFSVFTHLSERTCKAVLDSVLPSIKEDGIFTVTIRPPEFWEFMERYKKLVDFTAEALLDEHSRKGFAFYPEPNREAIDGDVPFGDATISLGYIRENWQDWRILGTSQNEIDPMQLLVHLTPA